MAGSPPKWSGIIDVRKQLLASLLVVAACSLAFTNVAVAVPSVFSEVSGSPFDTPGNGSVAAFDPSGRLLAVADGDGHVSMDTVAAGGVPTAVPGSPFAVGQSSASVAFDEQLTEVDGSPFASGEVRVGWRSARGIF